jgi:hypothetical protein
VQKPGTGAVAPGTTSVDPWVTCGKHIRGRSAKSALRRCAIGSTFPLTKFAEQLPAQLLGRRSRLWRCDCDPLEGPATVPVERGLFGENQAAGPARGSTLLSALHNRARGHVHPSQGRTRMPSSIKGVGPPQTSSPFHGRSTNGDRCAWREGSDPGPPPTRDGLKAPAAPSPGSRPSRDGLPRPQFPVRANRVAERAELGLP